MSGGTGRGWWPQPSPQVASSIWSTATAFTSIVPHFLPLATALVYSSGFAELVCAYGLWRRKRWAAVAATALLLAAWPANLQAAITAPKWKSSERPSGFVDSLPTSDPVDLVGPAIG